MKIVVNIDYLLHASLIAKCYETSLSQLSRIPVVVLVVLLGNNNSSTRECYYLHFPKRTQRL